jgi:hypothetical protein
VCRERPGRLDRWSMEPVPEREVNPLGQGDRYQAVFGMVDES